MLWPIGLGYGAFCSNALISVCPKNDTFCVLHIYCVVFAPRDLDARLSWELSLPAKNRQDDEECEELEEDHEVECARGRKIARESE